MQQEINELKHSLSIQTNVNTMNQKQFTEDKERLVETYDQKIKKLNEDWEQNNAKNLVHYICRFYLISFIGKSFIRTETIMRFGN